MSAKIYIGVDNKARKVYKAYIGVDNRARRIKKAYIGIGNVARLCYRFGGGGIEAYGKITALNAARAELAAATTGNYVLFAGGSADTTTMFAHVDCFDTSLVHSTPASLSEGKRRIAAATVGNYALFAGGDTYAISRNTVEAYSSSLVKKTATALSSVRTRAVAGSHNAFAVFAGGTDNYDRYTVGNVDTYNASLTRTARTALSVDRCMFASATVGDYILFAGGVSGGYDLNSIITPYDTVDAYNKSFTRSLPAVLSTPRMKHSGASTKDYAIFAMGGVPRDTYDDRETCRLTVNKTIEAYDSSLVRITLPDELSSVAEFTCPAAELGGYALFFADASRCYKLDNSLTLTAQRIQAGAVDSAAAASIGQYCIIAGGQVRSSVVTVNYKSDAYALVNIPEEEEI